MAAELKVDAGMADRPPPHALSVSPSSTLTFTLEKNPSDSSAKCIMNLTHTGETDDYLAFKVKTTQPRRYLVRPNQGLIAPGKTETITIVVVDKDKQSLLKSYDRLGQSALDHSKDKFLVQSCAVTSSFSDEHYGNGTEGKNFSDALTSLWSTASGLSVPVHNQKLHVTHIVTDVGETTEISKSVTGAPSPVVNAPSSTYELPPNSRMTPSQLQSELLGLKMKYDELVNFSVNLTAERDILNNTLEQTKRELKREMDTRAALENSSAGFVSIETKKETGGGGGGAGLMAVILVASFASLLAGMKIGLTSELPDWLDNVPFISNFLSG